MAARIALLVLVVTALIGASTVEAQTPPLVEPSVGVRAGVNFSKLQIKGASSSARTGFVGGFYGKFPLTDWMTFMLEALYSQKGFTKSNYQGITDWDLKTSYLDFPVSLRVDIPMKTVHPYIFGGFSPGVLLSASGKNSATGGEWIDTKDELKMSNFALVFGAGLRMNRWVLDFRFNNGTQNLNDSDADRDIRDRTFSLTLGYTLGISDF